MMRRSELIAAARDDYERGYIDGLHTYAWFKDGVEYVGTTGRTLTQAIYRFLQERGALDEEVTS